MRIKLIGMFPRSVAVAVSCFRVFMSNRLRGLPYMTSAEVSDFVNSSMSAKSVLYVHKFTAFLDPPSPRLLMSYMEAPLMRCSLMGVLKENMLLQCCITEA